MRRQYGRSGNTRRAPRLVTAVTSPISTKLLQGQLSYFRSRGFDPVLICAPGPEATEFARAEGIRLHTVPMEREISPRRDLVALWRLCLALAHLRPAIVNAGTPKAGLLVTLAAWLVRVPCRVYTMRGLRFETEQGMKRRILENLERLSCFCAHRVICISPSLRRRAIEQKIVSANKATALGSGSSNGLDIRRFTRTESVEQRAQELRASLGIPPDAFVAGFVGRIVWDKGIGELLSAWASLKHKLYNSYLVVVGDPELDDPALTQLLYEAGSDTSIRFVGFVEDTVPWYAAMDLLVLPTYREGFGNVLIEAAAMRLPVVATRIAGCMDAVQDGVTGTLVPAREVTALASAIYGYYSDPRLRLRHAEAGRMRVLREFQQEAIWRMLHAEYISLLKKKRQPLPTPRLGGE